VIADLTGNTTVRRKREITFLAKKKRGKRCLAYLSYFEGKPTFSTRASPVGRR